MSRICLVIVSWLLVIVSVTFADIGAVLRNGVGARGPAMGMAQVSIPQGADSVYWNPAALAKSKNVQLATSASEIYGTNYKTFGFTFPNAYGEWGVLILSADQQGIPETVLDTNGRPAATGAQFGYDAKALYLSYAREFGRLSAGLSAKYLAEGLAGRGANGIGLDVGVLLKASELLSFGLKMENLIASPLKWDTASGSSDNVETGTRMGTSMLFLDGKLLVSGDLLIRGDKTLAFFAGGEYKLIGDLLVRCGLFDSRPTFGLGLNYFNLTADYAYVKGNDYLDDSHRLSLSFTL